MLILTKKPELITVDRSNVEETGFFCYMSKRKSEGFLRKVSWAMERFDEGMRIKMLKLPERGFIEYIPGEYAWRAVKARGYMVIHCLWVIGKSKGKGFGAALLDECVKDARRAGMLGVAMVTSGGNWLAGRELLERRGFKAVDAAPPSFTLLVKKLRPGPDPSFPHDWAARAARFGKGLTILSSGQCPYHPDAGRILLDAAARKKIKARVVKFRTAADVQARSPSPYGVFSIVFNGRLVGYHYLGEEDALGLLARNA
jgi:GNAT superfamily N-acetyltransferase